MTRLLRGFSRADYGAFRSRRLMRTALNLYLVEGAILLVPLITLPYLSRTLEPANLGLMFFAQAYASVATLVVQYGYDFSASRDIAQARDDRHKLRAITAGVLSGKTVLVVVSAAMTVLIGLAIPLFRENPSYLAAAWVLSVAQGLNPRWYFLGRERLGVLTGLDIVSRVVAVVAIFALVAGPEDGLVVLVIQATTTAAGVGVALAIVCVRTDFPRLRLTSALASLRGGLQLGTYSILAAGALYAPSLLVGVLTSPLQVGYYGVADKLQKVPVAALWPLSQALYPRINRLLAEDPPQARRLTRASGTMFVGVGFAAGIALAASASWLVPFVFGPEFEEAAPVFRILALALPFGLLGHVLAYQVLMPLRRDRVLNYTAWASTALRLAVAIPLTIAFGALGMAWAVLAGWVVNAAALSVVVLTSSGSLFPSVARDSEGSVTPSTPSGTNVPS